ncbi:MAG: hypothetical protein U0324_32050 [Polyangiales bacterium]
MLGDWIKRAVLVALVAAAAWKGYGYWRLRNVTHQLVFKADGPPICSVTLRHEVGGAPAQEENSLAWESPPVTAAGTAEVAFTVDVPLSCGWQPEQVRCSIERDGAPWKDAVAQRINDPSTGTLTRYRCEITTQAWR